MSLVVLAVRAAVEKKSAAKPVLLPLVQPDQKPTVQVPTYAGIPHATARNPRPGLESLKAAEEGGCQKPKVCSDTTSALLQPVVASRFGRAVGVQEGTQ
eukprot:12551287-Alexandrium_andersonii.AAC.1